MICSIFPLIAGYFYANYIGKKVRAADEADAGEVTKTYEELVAEYGKLPGGWDSMAPIIVPIILMALSSISSMAGMTGIVKDILTFLGTPIIALAVGTIFAVIQLRNAGKMGEFYNLTNETLKTVGPILFSPSSFRPSSSPHRVPPLSPLQPRPVLWHPCCLSLDWTALSAPAWHAWPSAQAL